MTPKHLEIDSAYNEFDTNGDGIVSDEELAKAERMLQIENNDKMQDQQRLNGVGSDVVYHSGRYSPPDAFYIH
jgi:Ca2+-binding EF-hand superfamily protein